MYIKPERVLESFRRLRLRSSERGGKKRKAGGERTTILGVFLAYDMTRRGQGPLSLNPATNEGKENRTRFSMAFSKLLTLTSLSGTRALATYDLGEVTLCPNRKLMPESKLTDNFLTTQLKQAARGELLEYPKRPKNSPMMLLGPQASGSADLWEIKAHERWWENLPKFLAERRSKTPYLDLTVFLLRDVALDGRLSGTGVLEWGLRSTFSEQLAARMSDKVKFETRHQDGKWLLQNASTWLQEKYMPTFEEKDHTPRSSLEKRLRDYISELQELLTHTGTQFEPFVE